jgi:hypothetical protein
MKLKDISDWAASEIRTIKVMSDVCSIPLELSVRKFVPHPEDRLKRSWVDGKITKYVPSRFLYPSISDLLKSGMIKRFLPNVI